MNANVWMAALAGLVVGVGIGWVAKPAGDPVPDAVENEAVASDAPTRTTRPANSGHEDPSLAARISDRPAEENKEWSEDDLDPETQRMIDESQQRQTEMMKRGLKSKFDLRISRLVEELGLDAEQENLLRNYASSRIDQLDAEMMSGFSGMPDEEKISDFASLLRGEGIAEELRSHLNDEQLAGMDAVFERERNNSIEARALKDLSKLQGSLDLDADQRDQVYEVLMEDAESWLDRQSDVDFVMREMMSTMGVDMDFGDIDMSTMMELGSNGDSGEDASEMMRQMRETAEQQREAKVDRLSGILDETQLETYRQSLESQGGMMNMMFDSMEDE